MEISEGPFLYGENKTKITLPAFKIARYPITNSQFQCFIDDGGYEDDRWWTGLAEPDKNILPLGEGRVRAERGRWNSPNQPRETVSWFDAVAYTRWLTAKLQTYGLIPEGMTVRLPTEEEWEKAARGTDGRKFPWGDEFQSGRANINETGDSSVTLNLGQTTAVGIYPQGVSPYGVLDMAGNVWEWCLNEYDQPERKGTESEANRVVRGGSWLVSQGVARCAVRYRTQPDFRYYYYGFRVVLCSAPVL